MEPLDAALAALSEPLSKEERFYGWTDRSQRDWLAYLDGVKQGILISSDPEHASALYHLAEWLGRDGIDSHSPLIGLIADAQGDLRKRFVGSS